MRKERKVFKIPFSESDVSNGLWYYARKRVSQRGCNFILTPEFKDAIQRISYYLVNEERHFGLLVNGNPGNGKTTLAYAINRYYNHLISEGHINLGSTYLGRNYMQLVDARDFSMLFCDEYENWESFKTSSSLIIDDLGEDQRDIIKYGNGFCPFIELMEYRYKMMLPTIIFSNLTTQMIIEKYHSDRLTDRMREMFTIIPIYGKSFRKP